MPIISKLNIETVKFLADPDIRQKWASQGTEPRSSTPEALSQLMRNEFNKLRKVIKAASITAER